MTAPINKSHKTFVQELSKRSRTRRSQLKDSVALEAVSYSGRNDLQPAMRLEDRKIADLHLPERDVRAHKPAHEAEVAASIKKFGFSAPPIITEAGEIIDGGTKVAAAGRLGLTEIPCLVISDLSKERRKMLRIALNRLGEKGEWDVEKLKLEFEELMQTDQPIEITGFSLPEIEVMACGMPEVTDPADDEVPELNAEEPVVSQAGDSWQLGRHRLVCADATKLESYQQLFDENEKASAIFTDPPYNIQIDGFAVGKGTHHHKEFVAASGEMTDEEFEKFLTDFLSSASAMLMDGGVLFTCMDWRHAEHLMRAIKNAGLTLLTIAIWSKGSGGMGGLYRSAHEFVFVIKKGTKPIRNNVELGKNGRDRTNVWTYPGANRRGSSAQKELANHPTPKPVELVRDALLDVTGRNEIVLDPFLGSGTSIIAAEKIGRIVYGMELDPHYVDVIIRRFEAFTGLDAVHTETGKTFAEIKTLRRDAVKETPDPDARSERDE